MVAVRPMNVAHILAADRVLLDVDVASRKRVLETIGEALASADTTLSAKAVFQHLYDREELGSTGLGHGVALPHARMPDYGRTVAAFVRLSAGVDFAASDGEAVDLYFGLLVPAESTDEHLRILSAVAGVLNQAQVRARLRETASTEEVLGLLGAHVSAA